MELLVGAVKTIALIYTATLFSLFLILLFSIFWIKPDVEDGWTRCFIFCGKLVCGPVNDGYCSSPRATLARSAVGPLGFQSRKGRATKGLFFLFLIIFFPYIDPPLAGAFPRSPVHLHPPQSLFSLPVGGAHG